MQFFNRIFSSFSRHKNKWCKPFVCNQCGVGLAAEDTTYTHNKACSRYNGAKFAWILRKTGNSTATILQCLCCGKLEPKNKWNLHVKTTKHKQNVKKGNKSNAFLAKKLREYHDDQVDFCGPPRNCDRGVCYIVPSMSSFFQ